MAENEIKIFEVGGAVRDDLLGRPTKDVDFAVVAPSFDALRTHLTDRGFTIWQERPEHLTIRAGVPASEPALRARTKDADFVLCRKDGPSSDNRRPDFVTPGSLEDDLARRDFTINAIARDPETGALIDPHGGVQDLGATGAEFERARPFLRFVGDPFERIEEDGLRVVRGFRFMITHNAVPSTTTWDALTSGRAADLLEAIPSERIMEELNKMLRADLVGTLRLLTNRVPSFTTVAVLGRSDLRLEATMKG